tara:strand:- start:20 stop:622 length:603 start_codon:yes stop_codon:yes gene_type:complete
MNSKQFDEIKVNHFDNIVINIKQANKNIVNELLPGYTEESCSNESTPCELCWNCSHALSNQPISIPLKYNNNIFYIYGSFCQYSCGARYIFDTFNDKNKWNIYSLLNLYYNIINRTVGKSVNPSPNKLILQKFGGTMTIEEYRKTGDQYSLYLPPIIPIDHSITKISETQEIQSNKENFKLYRKKSLNSKNNIYQTMNLN